LGAARREYANILTSNPTQEEVKRADRGTLMQYLKGTDFPAEKEEVASNAESQNAPQDLVSQIRNAYTERFESAEEVMQALQGPSDVARRP
jgi:uncharacterized protein DUF2795